MIPIIANAPADKKIRDKWLERLWQAMAALRWLCEGWGYEVTSADFLEAYDRAMDAAAKLDNIDAVVSWVQQLLDSTESPAALFVRQSLTVS